MRIFIRGAIALVILVAAYWGWALAGTAQLASAAQRGDPAAVMERVDITALSHSLSGQIARAYLKQNPELQKLLQARGITGGVGMNAAAAEMLLRALLTPENIAAILNRGSAGLPGGADAGGLQMPALGNAFRAAPVKAVLSSYFVSPGGFVVGLDSPDGRYGVHMNLSGTTWRLSGVDIPDAVTARVARVIAQRLNGALDLHGG